jgi:sortase A
MRVRTRPNMLCGAALTGVGAALVAYVAAILVTGIWVESRDRFKLAAALTQGVPLLVIPDPRHRADKSSGAKVVPISTARTNLSPLGLGILEIDRLGLSVLIRSSTTSIDLDKGAGWIPGTALPGDAGNVVLTGHRDTFFRDLRGVKRGDIVRLRTPFGPRSYTVTETSVVDPADTSVLRPTAKSTLTLITCFPFDFIGHAPKRFIVRASGVSNPAQ